MRPVGSSAAASMMTSILPKIPRPLVFLSVVMVAPFDAHPTEAGQDFRPRVASPRKIAATEKVPLLRGLTGVWSDTPANRRHRCSSRGDSGNTARCATEATWYRLERQPMRSSARFALVLLTLAACAPANDDSTAESEGALGATGSSRRRGDAAERDPLGPQLCRVPRRRAPSVPARRRQRRERACANEARARHMGRRARRRRDRRRQLGLQHGTRVLP